MRSGYCTSYASAMAVMARTLGIPARVAVGYATGSYDQAQGVYLVTEAEAHAWPELHIGGQWIAFEPTPIRPLPARGPQTAPPPAVVTAPLPVPALAGLLLAAALLGGTAAWLRPPARRQALRARLARAGLVLSVRLGPPAQTPEGIRRQLTALGDYLRIPWPAGAPMQEYGLLLVARRIAGADMLAAVLALLERATSSRGGLPLPERRALARARAGAFARLRRSTPARVL